MLLLFCLESRKSSGENAAKRRVELEPEQNDGPGVTLTERYLPSAQDRPRFHENPTPTTLRRKQPIFLPNTRRQPTTQTETEDSIHS